MSRMPSSVVIPTSSFAMEEARASDSSTHGPAIRNNGVRREVVGERFFTGKQQA
jgi:hypothetical protein